MSTVRGAHATAGNDAGPWALRLSRADARAAGILRLRGGIVALDAGGELWIRGEARTKDLDAALRMLPAERFVPGSDGLLRREGERVPCERLPAGEWKPLAQCIVPECGTAALPAPAPATVPLRVVRSVEQRDAGLLRATFPTWAAWALAAPAVRLGRLVFAAADADRVVIVGQPLPPIRGCPYVLRECVALPCGYGLSPDVDPPVVRALLGLATGDVALFSVDGSWQKVEAAGFVAATRGAVRWTARAMRAGGVHAAEDGVP